MSKKTSPDGSYVIRPVSLQDLDAILELAKLASFGLTTLPQDRVLLKTRIDNAIRSFRNLDRQSPGGDPFLFVMEHFPSRQVVGICGLISKSGGFEPNYSYRIETVTHSSKMLGIEKEIPVLYLDENHDGPAEIGSLFLHPDHRHAGIGRTLSLSRFLFMAQYLQLMETEVIAEMRGVLDENGGSPFWNALGKHFFDLEFPKADYLSIVNKEFIGDLMPRYPIYIPLLPVEAQRVIGVVHEWTLPARKLLESEGFEFRQFVDIFEAGPMLHCPIQEIRSIKESRLESISDLGPVSAGDSQYLVASFTKEFRCCLTSLDVVGSGVKISSETAEALSVTRGDAVRYVPFRSIGRGSS